MKKEINKFIDPIDLSLKELLCGTADQVLYQILELYECENTGFLKALIKTPEGKLMRKKIADIVNNMRILEKFDKKTIRTLTYLAAIETIKPDYSIASQQFGSGADNYILNVRSRHERKTQARPVREIFKDKSIISGLSPADANRVGYLAGVKETVEEFNLRPKFNFDNNILACMPGLVYWLDKDNIYQGCNDLLAQTIGLTSKKEIIGKTNKKLIWKNQAEELDYFNNTVMHSRIGQTKEEIVQFGNDTRIFISEKVPLFNNRNEVIGIVGVSVEVTEQEKWMSN